MRGRAVLDSAADDRRPAHVPGGGESASHTGPGQRQWSSVTAMTSPRAEVIPSALRRNTEARLRSVHTCAHDPSSAARAVTVRQDHFRPAASAGHLHARPRAYRHVGPRLLGRDDDGERWGRRLGHGSLLERAVGGRILPERGSRRQHRCAARTGPSRPTLNHEPRTTSIRTTKGEHRPWSTSETAA